MTVDSRLEAERQKRKDLVDRHKVRMTTRHPANVLTVGNGDLALSVDMTGLQTFPHYHELREDPLRVVDDGVEGLPEQATRPFDIDDYQIPLRTQSTWGWYSTYGRRSYSMTETETSYQTSRGSIRYPDKMGLLRPEDGIPAEDEAASWLALNPRRMHLGRLALRLASPLSERVTLDDIEPLEQELDLWSGIIRSRFMLDGVPVTVTTAAHPTQDLIAVRVESTLVREGLCIEWIFEDQKDALTEYETMPTALTEWVVQPDGATARRTLGALCYDVSVLAEGADVHIEGEHSDRAIIGSRQREVLEVSIGLGLATEAQETRTLPQFDAVIAASTVWWEEFWTSGVSISFSGSTDPRAYELERRVVLSQYLTAVNCSGHAPPQETGLTYNSWGGKFHLEMHWWHAAHFATWGRGHLLARSLSWYRRILPQARATARAQGYQGARWPKQTDPSGRESPSIIGVFLIWQQPHIIHLLELLWSDEPSVAFLKEHADLVFETADFMADFAERRGDVFVLPAPLIPAQESYLTTRAGLESPTFELAYWQWALGIAVAWKRRLGLEPPAEWIEVAENLQRPTVLDDGTYAAIATAPFLIREDHPATLMALGFIPETPLVDVNIMRATFASVLDNWNLQSTWGWDYPVLALTAVRLGDLPGAIESLLMETPKNHFLPNGHNPQMPGFLSLYLPGNGGLLYAIRAIAEAAAAGEPVPAGWTMNFTSTSGPARTQARAS